MLKKQKTLFIVSATTLLIGVFCTWITHTDAFGYNGNYGSGCVKKGNDVNCNTKNGDMYIYTSHGGYYGRSGRLGSRGNRNYHGGGVCGGK